MRIVNFTYSASVRRILEQCRSEFLSRVPSISNSFPPTNPITDLALAVRKLVLEEAPGATELIYDAYSAVAVGYSFTGRPSDAFIHIAAYARWVNLGFNYGSQLEDPQQVLQGTGQWMRHIRIADPGEVKNPVFPRFVKSWSAQAGRPDPTVRRP